MKCTLCKGSGEIQVSETDWDPCHRCNGTGIINQLMTLEQFNNIKMEQYKPPELKGNGIACPNCGAELSDNRPNMVLSSYPPKKNVSCTKCDFTGYRIV